MCVYHRRRHVLVPEQFLNGANVVAAFEQVGRKGMPKGVTAGSFFYFRSANREFHRIELRQDKMARGRLDIEARLQNYLAG
jgi:hypothetical protein